MAKGIIVFAGGVYATGLQFLHVLTNAYADSAIKGLIGGVTAYLGTLLMTWTMKKVMKPALKWIQEKFKQVISKTKK